MDAPRVKNQQRRFYISGMKDLSAHDRLKLLLRLADMGEVKFGPHWYCDTCEDDVSTYMPKDRRLEGFCVICAVKLFDITPYLSEDEE